MLPREMTALLPLPVLPIVLFLAACTGADSADDSGPVVDTSPGSLALAFQMEEDLIVSMDAPPVGTFYGSIYAEDDATAIGPNDGAVSLEDFSAEMDLSDGGGPTATLYTTGALASDVVWVLGCLDVDANGCGDEGDPITVPNDDKLVVPAAAETAVTVQMNMLRP